ncbi:MAG: DUF1289 domain-containing protein [Aestuariibacter sp.]
MDITQRPISPCQGLCRFDDSEQCLGCFRKRDDIDNWFYLSDQQKVAIIAEVTPKIAAAKKKSAI